MLYVVSRVCRDNECEQSRLVEAPLNIIFAHHLTPHLHHTLNTPRQLTGRHLFLQQDNTSLLMAGTH
jgi:hypothetical protein